MIRAVLFDVDGTLVDSEPTSVKSIIELFRRDYGATVTPADIVPFYGSTDMAIFTAFNARFNVSDDIKAQIERRSAVYESLAHEIREVPGAAAFVSKCRAAGLKIAVATSAATGHMEANLGALDIPASYFDYVINGEMVSKAKPDPEIYLRAAQGVGIAPQECLVLEDSVNGHLSARNAGMPSLGIRGTISDEASLSSGASALMDSFLDFPDFDSIQSFNEAYASLLH